MGVKQGQKIAATVTDEELAEEFGAWEEQYDNRADAVREAVRRGIDMDDEASDEGQFREGLIDGLFAGTITVCLLLVGQAALVWGVLPAVGIGLGGVAAFAAGILIPIRELA